MITKEVNDALCAEKSWIEVAGGLGKVLLGYGVLVLGTFIAAGFFYSAFAPMIAGKQMKLEHKWFFYIGITLSLITSLAAWGLIIAGQWRCLMGSSERNGAKWVIFMCMTCVIMSPVLQKLAWLGGSSARVQWLEGPEALRGVQPKFTQAGTYIMAASLISGFLYKASFWYFLQTVAGCMGATKARVFVFLYPVLVLAMTGATGYWLFGHLHPNRFTMLAPYVAGGWVFLALYWVAMILVVKVAIEQTVEQVYNPMRQPQMSMAGS